MMELRVEKLCKRYGDAQVLRNVSFTAGVGVSGIMAPSGAGKTTLLRILLGLEQPDSGSVWLPERCRLSAVFQEDRLLESRTAAENIRFAAGGAVSEGEIRALLEQLGLEDSGQPVAEFSGGMRRRAALARALAVPFDLLVLDEPFTGLDGESRRRCRECILRQSAGRIVLLVSHDPEDIRAMGGTLLPWQEQ